MPSINMWSESGETNTNIDRPFKGITVVVQRIWYPNQNARGEHNASPHKIPGLPYTSAYPACAPPNDIFFPNIHAPRLAVGVSDGV